jgi:uncharacterized membrane protein YbhN (UPF0104 family)
MKTLIKLLITALIFYLIFRHTDVREVGAVLRQVDPALLAAGFVAQLASTVVASWRWSRLMAALGFGGDYPFYLRSYFKGAFFNQGLPTSIGGDAVRVLDVARREAGRKRDAFAGVLLDRVVGLSGLLVLNLVANNARPDLLPAGLYWLINLVTVGSLAGVVVLALLRHVHGLAALSWTRLFYELSRRFAPLWTRPGRLAGQLALAVLTHTLSILAIFWLGASLGMGHDPVTFLIIVPPVILLTLIPVSLAGWGVREGAMIGLFTLLGADRAVVLSMSLLYGVALIVTSLPGLYVYITGRHRL